jgi:hypothetical protein
MKNCLCKRTVTRNYFNHVEVSWQAHIQVYNSTIVTTQKTNKYRQWHVIVMLAYSLYIWKRF